MAAPSLTYTLINGATADASQVMQNFNDLLNGVTDGTKDLSISALTCAGTATLNGHVNLGNSSADDLTVTASLASNLPIKTNNTYGLGSATLGLSGVYLGNGGAGATCRVISASHATTRSYSVPDCSAAANFLMSESAQTANGVITFANGALLKGTTAAGDASAGYLGEYMQQVRPLSDGATATNNTYVDVTASPLALTAGDWDVSLIVGISGTLTGTQFNIGIGTATGNSATGITDYNSNATPTMPTATTDVFLVVPPFRINISGTTNYYPKVRVKFTGGTCVYYGRISARRIR
jgi:hypothetical protein